MTDEQDSGTAGTSAATQRDSTYSALWVAGLIAVGLWVYTTIKAASLHSDLEDVANDFFRDASAVQISQVADQSLVEILPFVAASTAATVLALIIAAAGLLRGR